MDKYLPPLNGECQYCGWLVQAAGKRASKNMNKKVWLLFSCQALMIMLSFGRPSWQSLVVYHLSGTALSTLPMAIQMMRS